jgi:hypothetical protein
MGWLSNLLGRQSAPKQPAPPAGAVPPGPPGKGGAAQVPSQKEGEGGASAPPVAPLLCWLFAAPTPEPQTQPLPAEREAIDLVDRVLKLETLPPELLPRSANVVPRLIALLRQEAASVQDLVDRISQDPALVIEVMRQAGSARYGHLGPAPDLPQAIRRLGSQGLEMAIARVLLRPLYQSQAGSLVAVAAPKLWLHADTLARHGTDHANQAGAAGFDGYLAGLLHDVGWTVLFHALQRGGVSRLDQFSEGGIHALTLRAHRLFGRAAAPWQITPAFTAFSVDALRVPLTDSADPLARALLAAEEPSMVELLGGQMAADPV